MEIIIPHEPKVDDKSVWDHEVPIIKSKDVYHAYLHGSIEDPFMYNKLAFSISTLDKGEQLILHINTPGGVIDSALAICDAMKNTQGIVIAHLTGTVASAGTIIPMFAHRIIISDHLSFMVHNYSSGLQGKGHELKSQQKFQDAHLNEFFRTAYAGFLTEDEMDAVIDGRDMWLNSEEVKERWDRKVAA